MYDPKDYRDSELRSQYRDLRTRTRALVDEARAITGPPGQEKELNAQERAQLTEMLEKAKPMTAQRRAIEDEQDRREFNDPRGYDPTLSPNAEKRLNAMTGYKSTTTSKGSDDRWSRMAMTQLQRFDPYGGMGKSLASSGSVLVPTSFDTSIVREGERPTLVRELLPSQSLTGTDRFAYLRQSARINNATTVAKGALKPTSSYKVERLEDRARVIAHLSEPIDRVDLEDAADLGSFLDSEMRYGVLAAGEDQIINGDGNGENQIGILHTAGVLAQPFSGDALTTLRKALTVQQGLSNTPTAWVLSPADWESLELLREGGATGAYMLSQGPVDRAAQRLWGLPVVVSSAIATGRAILGDWAGSARLYQREEVQVTWSDGVWASDGAGGGSIGFQRNQLTMRAEERVGLAVLRPSAFADIDLAA